jgi:hypothetical protein
LAELIDGKNIDWEGMTSLQIRQKLEQTFRKPYEKLFSPHHNSPLYRKTLRIRRRA